MWLETTQGIITLVLALITLISTTITLGIKLSNALKLIIKNKNWLKIASIADRAMEAAEKSGAKGETKKAQVIEATKAGCLELNIDVTEYFDQLSVYIDECVEFFNKMKDATIAAKIKIKATK